MTQKIRIYSGCQFSNEMSQSQNACHKDVTYDTHLRLLRGFEGQIAVFSDLARPAHIWSDGALGCASASGFARSSAWWIDCVLPIHLFVAERTAPTWTQTVIAGSSGCLVRVRTDSSSSGGNSL